MKKDVILWAGAGQTYGEVAMFINAAGLSPSQASVETILKVDLYGTAVLSTGEENCLTAA